MSVEGLKVILEKEEIIVTYQSQDFIDRPKQVDEIYKSHLRTYVPMHSGAGADALSAEVFTQRFVQAVQNGRVPRGYVTADFGYGKTSTGLYIWGQAADSRLLAIPPFQLNSLMDFITASYGWVNYILGSAKPSLQKQAFKLYEDYRNRSVAWVATQYEIPIEKAERLANDRPQILELAPEDISHFFCGLTELAQEAGFLGLVVIADEVQQYLEPEIKAGKRDPIGPLFNIIQNLGGQTGLHFGLLLIIPSKELGVINDQRGDLIDRMRKMALDLSTIYDQEFPNRLWTHLAKTFEFEDHACRVLRAETLFSLGQIAVRDDLANGPRTVVNAMRSAIQRYLNLDTKIQHPYSPIDLINDFLSGNNVFDGTKRIQEVVSKALDNVFVRTDPVRCDAIRLAGAFPTDGATNEIQSAFGLELAFRDLRTKLYGDVVIEVGDRSNPGTTLRGLEAVKEPADWLLLSLREFNRNYYENSAIAKTRAIIGFKSLLKTQIFKNDWKVNDELETSSVYNAGLIIEGAFANFRREFPSRRVHVSIIFDDELTHSNVGAFDIWLEFHLHRYLDIDIINRKDRVGKPILDEINHCIDFELNLMRYLPGAMNLATENVISKVVASEILSPLYLLTLYSYLDNLMQAGNVPKTDQPLLTMQFMPSLLESAVNILFDRTFGSEFDSSGTRLIEKLMLTLLRNRYGTDYHTFMVIGTWRNSLRDYINILNRLPSPLHRQGFIPLEGTKEEIATLFNMSNSTLDNFMNTFPDLIEVLEDFTKTKAGRIRMRFHPLEERMKSWITISSDSIQINDKKAHSIPEERVYKIASPLGYRQDEIEQAILLLIERKWAVRDQNGNIYEIPPIDIKPEDVKQAIKRLAEQVHFARQAYPDAVDLIQFDEDSKRLNETLVKIQPPTKVIDPRIWQALLTRAQRDSSAVDIILQRQKSVLLKNLDSLKDQCSRIQLIDKATLVDPDPQGILAEPLGNLKTDLTRRAENLEKDVIKLNQSLESIHQRISTEQDSEKSFLKMIEQTHLSEDDLPKLLAKVQSMETQFRGYDVWIQISISFVDILSQLDQLPSEGDPLRIQFNNIKREIDQIISQGWELALSQGQIFERRLKTLADQIRQISTHAAQQFDILQHIYLDALRKVNCPKQYLPEVLVYSPLDPERVYAQFYLNAQKAVVASLDSIDNEIQQYCSQIRQKLLMQDINETVQKTLLKLESELDNLSSQLPYSKTNDLDYIKDKNRFLTLLSNAQAIHDSLRPYSRQLGDMNNHVELTENEKYLIEYLSKSDLLNLADLWVGIDAPITIDIWNTIQKLWEKNKIQVLIKQIIDKTN